MDEAEARRLLSVAADDSDRPSTDSMWSQIRYERIRRSRFRMVSAALVVATTGTAAALGVGLTHHSASSQGLRAQTPPTPGAVPTVTVVRTTTMPAAPNVTKTSFATVAAPAPAAATVTNSIRITDHATTAVTITRNTTVTSTTTATAVTIASATATTTVTATATVTRRATVTVTATATVSPSPQ